MKFFERVHSAFNSSSALVDATRKKPVTSGQFTARSVTQSIPTTVFRVAKFTVCTTVHPFEGKMMLRGCLFLIIVSVAVAQVPFLGQCPNLETMPNFDLNRYVGKWYEVERYFAIFEFGGKCVTANYSQGENGLIKILNKQISSLTGVSSSIEGIGRVIGRTEDPKLTVTFPSLPLPFDAPYWILDTDYKSYAVVWSCSNFGVFSVRNAWILTREPKPPVSILEKAYQVIDKNNISRAYFIRTDQKNCPEGN